MYKTIAWGACLLAGCANACDEGAATAHRTAQAPNADETSESAGPPLDVRSEAPIEGTLASKEQLATLLLDRVGEFEATGPTTTIASKLPSGRSLPQARRNYAKGDIKLEIEVMDTLYTPAVRAMVMRAQTMKRQSPQNFMMGFDFGGHPAIKQWTKVNDTARVGTLIGERLIVNVNVTPASSPDIAVTIAQSVDYDAAAALLAAVEKADPKPGDTAASSTAAVPK